MENYRVDKLRAELNQLLKKQSQVLESRSLGSATDTELLEYEIRQEIVHDLCNEQAHSIAEERPAGIRRWIGPSPMPANRLKTLRPSIVVLRLRLASASLVPSWEGQPDVVPVEIPVLPNRRCARPRLRSSVRSLYCGQSPGRVPYRARNPHEHRVDDPYS